MAEDLRSKAKRLATGKKNKKVKPAISNGAIYSRGTLEALVSELKSGKNGLRPSVIDDIIVKNGIKGVPFRDIARLVDKDPKWTYERFWEILQREEGYTPEQMKLYVAVKLREVINFMSEQAELGNTDAAKNIISALGELTKLADSYQNDADKTIAAITAAQTAILLRVIDHVVGRVISAIAPNAPREQLDVVVVDAMSEVGELLAASEAERVEL